MASEGIPETKEVFEYAWQDYERGQGPRPSVRTLKQRCALVYSDQDNHPAGVFGQAFDKDCPVSISLFHCHPGNSSHFLGIKFQFPRLADNSHGSFYEGKYPSAFYSVVGRFPLDYTTFTNEPLPDNIRSLFEGSPHRDLDKWQLLTLKIDGSSLEVEGFGMPFWGTTETVTAWANGTLPMCGTLDLIALLKQTEFQLVSYFKQEDFAHKLVNLSDLDTSPFDYGYGNTHQWNYKLYSEQIYRNSGTRFAEALRWRDFPSMAVCLTQPHVQDVFHFHTQLASFAKVEHKAVVWKLGRKPISETNKFVAIVRVEPEVVSYDWVPEAYMMRLTN